MISLKIFLICIGCIAAIMCLELQGIQEEIDSVIFDLKPEKIEDVKSVEDEYGNFWIHITLKEEYHGDFADLTEDNIGNVLNITYQNEVYAQPVIRSRITGGRFMLGPFEANEEAQQVFEMIQEGKKKVPGL